MDAAKSRDVVPSRIAPEDVARKMKKDYDFGARDQFDRSLDAIQKLIVDVSRPDMEVSALVDKVVKLIYRQFHIKEVSIGLKSEADGRFRYATMMGMRASIWSEHQKLSYDQTSLFDERVYKFTNISGLTRLFLAEDNPYDVGEEGTYNEHLTSTMKRMTIDDSIEGDYLDILIFNGREQLVGWIEATGTWENKLPNSKTIKSLEIMASLIGHAMTIKRYQ